MPYQCRCEDGPAQGTEFLDYGPTVRVQLPYGGRVLEYRLTNIEDKRCIYQFAGLADGGQSQDPGEGPMPS
jgi:hypothetical protein